MALTEREAESGDADVIGDVRNCLSLARSLFVDEIFFSVPAEKKLVIDMVEEARVAGIDVRVVPQGSPNVGDQESGELELDLDAPDPPDHLQPRAQPAE